MSAYYSRSHEKILNKEQN